MHTPRGKQPPNGYRSVPESDGVIRDSSRDHICDVTDPILYVDVKLPRGRTRLVMLATWLYARDLLPLSVLNWTLRRLYVKLRVGSKWEHHPMHLQFRRTDR